MPTKYIMTYNIFQTFCYLNIGGACHYTESSLAEEVSEEKLEADLPACKEVGCPALRGKVVTMAMIGGEN